jgi:integrase
MTRSGVVYQRQTAARPISATGSGSWPTPTASLGSKGGRVTPRKDALDLFYLTAQRISDTLKMDDRHIRDDQLWIQQGKTGAKRRIEIVGELKVLLTRIAKRKAGYRIRSTKLVVLESGQPMTYAMSRGRLDRAREAAGIEKSLFQMRDLRAKAATDKEESTGNILQARDQLGHTTVGMTEQYIRARKGLKVTPTK